MNYITDGDSGKGVLVLAHGAGAPMDSEFMNRVARGVAEQGIQVIRFEFPYMEARRNTGKKRPPDRQAVLLERWEKVIEELGGPQRLVIGGKSMGGRMASLIATRYPVRGLVCLGYPFHPPGKPERLRTEHFTEVCVPTLIVQGERDALGNRGEVEGYGLPDGFNVVWLGDGDHDFKPRVRSGISYERNIADAVAAVVEFMARLEQA
jgi:hypothetical protein